MIFLARYWKWILGIALFLIYSLIIALLASNWGESKVNFEKSLYEAKNEEIQHTVDSLTILLDLQMKKTKSFEEEEAVQKNRQIKTVTKIKVIEKKYEVEKYNLSKSAVSEQALYITNRLNQ